MVKNYESVIIINAALEDEQIDLVISKIVDNLKLNGGEVIDVDKWGRKRLAYPIQKKSTIGAIRAGLYAIRYFGFDPY